MRLGQRHWTAWGMHVPWHMVCILVSESVADEDTTMCNPPLPPLLLSTHEHTPYDDATAEMRLTAHRSNEQKIPWCNSEYS